MYKVCQVSVFSVANSPFLVFHCSFAYRSRLYLHLRVKSCEWYLSILLLAVSSILRIYASVFYLFLCFDPDMSDHCKVVSVWVISKYREFL